MADTSGPWNNYQAKSSGPWNDYAQNIDTSQQPMPWADVPGEALSNAPDSAMNLVKAVGHTVMHPIDTAVSLGNVTEGAGESLGRALNPNDKSEVSDQEKAFQAAKNFYGDRYGSEEGFKKALATDPVGVLADFSMVLSGGGTAAARLPGVAGKVGEVVAKAGNLTNPVNAAIKVPLATAKGIGKLAPSVIGDIGTRTGETSISQAFQAGKEGGSAAQNFLKFMTDETADPKQSVELARNAVQELKVQKNKAYQEGMAGIEAATEKAQWENKSLQMQHNARAEDSGHPTMAEPPAMMKFDNVDNKLVELNKLGDYQGYDMDPAVSKARELVSKEVSDFKNMDPGAFHTPMGFDALKQRLYSLSDQFEPGSRARLYMDKAAGAVKQSIVDEAPQYSKVMKDYWEASDFLREAEGELSLGPKANPGTTLRKLQSVMRNNATTNYGYRKNLAGKLEQFGAKDLPYQLAGQALNKWTPRGLGAGAAWLDALAAFGSGHLGLLAALPLMSPRLMGNAAYRAGQAARPLSKLPTGALTSPGATNLLSGASIPARSYLGDNQ